MTKTRSLLGFACTLSSVIACGAGGASNGGADPIMTGGTGNTSSTVGSSNTSGGASPIGGSNGANTANGGAMPLAGSAGSSNPAGSGNSNGVGASSGGATGAGGMSNLGGSAGMSHPGGASSGGANAGGGASSGGAANNSTLPAKIVGGYYPNWTDSPPRIKDVNANYNLIYLFAATPVGGAPGTTGAITWTAPGNGLGAATNFNADIAYARKTQHRKIILSVGGAGNGMSFPNRTKSQAFVDSVASWYTTFGGFDGLDWNTFEGNQTPDTSEMIWISLQLKQRYAGFIISAPPAPWNSVDQAFCSAMVQAGALDYAAPQYYDGPDLATQDYMVTNVAEWVTLIGASKLVVGFGIWDQPNYMSLADATSTWNALEKASPTLRGAFDWQIFTDLSQGSPFAAQLAPLILQ